jgi:hypothetical protein
MWNKIPKDIMDELAELRAHTRKTGNEASFTFCKRPHKPDKLYIGSDFQGDDSSVDVGDCDKATGKGTRIGDAHSHPIESDTVGLTPSDADVAGMMEATYRQKRKQIACITAPYREQDIVHCMEAKKIPTKQQIKGYSQIPKNPYKFNPYVIDNVAKDVDVALFDRDSGNRIENPEPKRVIKNAFGKSRRHLQKTRRKMEYGAFCEYIQDVFVPNDDRIQDECKAELRRKGLLDYLGIV